MIPLNMWVPIKSNISLLVTGFQHRISLYYSFKVGIWFAAYLLVDVTIRSKTESQKNNRKMSKMLEQFSILVSINVGGISIPVSNG